MNPDDLRALLSRLESATGPDRDLDAQIYFAFECVPNEGQISKWADCWGNASLPADRFPYLTPGPDFCPTDGTASREYTASLDAAGALVDRFGMSWSKSMEGFVCVHDREGGGTFRPNTESTALPIKLLAAMVRALGARAEPELRP